MKIILKRDLEKIGKKGEIKEVTIGYARNYLIPKRLAILATEQVIKESFLKKKRQEEEKKKADEGTKKIAEKIKDQNISIRLKANNNGLLYGRPTEQEICQKINNTLGVNIKTKCLQLNKLDLKKIGEYEIPIIFNQKISSKIKLNIIKE